MKHRPLAVASMGSFAAAVSTSLVAISAPAIAKDLSVSQADVSWVLSAYLLAVSSLLALAGRAADVVGRKRLYLTGFVFFVAGSSMCATAPTLRALVGARALQGVGGAMLMAVGPAIVTRAVPPARRARSLGIQLAATYVGLTLGPSLGGMIAARLGWHAVFVVIAGAGALAGTLALFLLPADADTGPEERSIAALDLGGAALLATALTALLVGLKHTQASGWTSPTVLAIGLCSVATFAMFARHESLHRSPLLPIGLFKTPAFAGGIGGATLLYTITYMLAYLLPFHLQGAAGLGPAEAGALMTAQPVTTAVISPLSGAIADRWGPRIPSAAGMVAMGAGMLGVARWASHPDVRLVVALALIGVGAGLYVAPNSALIMGSAPRDRQGMAGAMAATSRNVGMTLGIAVAVSLHHAIGFERTLFVAVALSGVGALLGVVRPVLGR